jgi:hypothetical protein
MRKFFFCMMILIASAAVCGNSYSDDNFNDEADLARDVIRAERRLAIFRVMELSAGEKAGFWALYDEYTDKMEKTGDRMVALIREYSEGSRNVSDEKALAMMNELIAIEKERLDIKSEYIKKFQTILPGVRVARLFQAENKLDVQRDLNLSSQVPLVGGKAAQQEDITRQ